METADHALVTSRIWATRWAWRTDAARIWPRWAEWVDYLVRDVRLSRKQITEANLDLPDLTPAERNEVLKGYLRARAKRQRSV